VEIPLGRLLNPHADDTRRARAYISHMARPPGPQPTTEAITVVIADDQRVVREGLTMVLGLMPGVEIVGAASDGEEALALARELKPDVILMDLRMPRCDGVEATRRITEGQPDTKVVVLTTYADDHSVIQALRAGACGFLTKDAASPQIAAALQAAKRGEAAIDPAVQHHLVKAIARTAPLQWEPPDQARLPDGLTPREAAVLALIAEGLSNAEIADRLTVTETTVKSHINHLYGKTGVRDRAQAVAYAYRHGLAPGAAGD
jgi:DNA-binding NarL/FixJ family response regulator